VVRAYVAAKLKAKKPRVKWAFWADDQGNPIEPRGVYDFDLTFRAAIETERTGRVPSPEEVAQKPMQWYTEVFQQMDWIDYEESRQGEGSLDIPEEG